MRTAVQTERLEIHWQPEGFEQVTFWLAPPDGLAYLRMAAREGPGPPAEDVASRLEREAEALAQLIEEWDGVDALDAQGQATPAPRKPPHALKVSYLRQHWHLGVMRELGERLAEETERRASRGKGSGSGFASAAPAPTLIAESTWTAPGEQSVVAR